MKPHTWTPKPNDYELPAWTCARCGCRRHRSLGYARGFKFIYSPRTTSFVPGMPAGFARWSGQRPECRPI